jgi:hypothetical protein
LGAGQSTEIIRSTAGGSDKRGNIVLFIDHVVAIPEA